ncbi:MAG: DUF2283 domain-containing protein [Acidimicrobiales bacterium]
MYPKVTYVPGDIVYYELREADVVNTLEPSPQIHVDVDAEGRAINIEIVGASAMPFKRVADVFDQFGIEVAYRPKVAS